MKKIFGITSIAVVLVSIFSCNDFLDINENTNKATTSTPELVLPQAITYTARNIVRFSQYGGAQVGHLVNAGGYGGWGSFVTYTFTTSDYQGLWNDTYDNLADIQYVIDQSKKGDSAYFYYQAAARVLKSFNFQMLVDTYNDVPYSEALKGIENLTASYDEAEVIYKNLANDLDTAIALFNSGAAIPTAFPSADPLFGGDIELWAKFANTIKLRLILRGGDKVQFTNRTFDPVGFLEEDAIVNPGYAKQDGKQNPAWDYYAYDFSGSTSGRVGLQYIPSNYVFSFYDGKRLNDPDRGYATFKSFPSTPLNQLGYTKSDAKSALTPNTWFLGANADSKTVGIFKGFNAGQPLMLAAESYFLQAEWASNNEDAAGAGDAFNAGIEASFAYLFTNASGTVTEDVAALVAAYQTENATKYLVNFALADTKPKRTEAIITQKYIAMNMINGLEAWNDYRRTLYPAIVNGSDKAIDTFASNQSSSGRPDKLPTRILYPNTEYQYNPGNIPPNIDALSTTIFWAK